jgi:site-specific recombinase XerD
MSGSPPRGALVRSLAPYLEERGGLVPTALTPSELRVADYRRYLERVRGLSTSTIEMHGATITRFLRFLDHDAHSQRLHDLRDAEVEAFIAQTGRQVGRSRMGQVTTVLRTFLRFLAARGETPPGLDAKVESPRIYRGERLPRALPWETVRTFLKSIDRTTPKGQRDFAMFLLIATYGLRASEVAALNLDDVAWRTCQIHVPRPKTGTPLLLPLTDEIGAALLDYLRRGRPASTERRLFLRVEAPLGPLGRGAVGDAFRAWARRAGISLPARGGPHCLRHALALRLLREGVTLKTIGDLLGHRSAESTGVYLRLDVDDLRDVALPLPAESAAEEVRP